MNAPARIAELERQLHWAQLKIQVLEQALRQQRIQQLGPRSETLCNLQLQLLAEAFPGKDRLGVLWDDQTAEQFASAEQEAQKMQLAMTSIKLMSSPYDFEKAFRTAEDNGVQILLVLSSPLFAPHNKEIVDLSMRYQLPTMFTFKYYVAAGGLRSYGIDTIPIFRRAASFVGARDLTGATAPLP